MESKKFKDTKLFTYRLPTMLSLASSLASGCYRRASGSHRHAAHWLGRSILPRSMATATNGFPARPGSAADLDSHILAALLWSAQRGATLGHLSREFNANAGRVLNVSLPYESKPPLSRRLTFDKPDSSKGRQGVVMVAHCMSLNDDLNRQKAIVKISSGFVIGDGLVVTCAHTFEEVSPSAI